MPKAKDKPNGNCASQASQDAQTLILRDLQSKVNAIVLTQNAQTDKLAKMDQKLDLILAKQTPPPAANAPVIPELDSAFKKLKDAVQTVDDKID